MYNIKYIILFILIATILYNCYSTTYYIEGYDASIPNITPTQCGTECTNRMKCAGFGYKPKGGVCYISTTAILGEPLNKLFSENYSKLDRRCNKINKITDNDQLNSTTLTDNSIYMCADGENNINSRFQYANYGASSLDDYGTTIFDAIYADIPETEKVEYLLNTDDIEQKGDYISGFITEPNEIKYKFVETNDEAMGLDVPGQQCTVNVPLNSCLLKCKNNNSCIGVDWNKYINTNDEYDDDYENVCCQKSKINKMIPRREQFKMGKFYKKINVDNITDENTLVIDNIEKEDISNQFNVYIPEMYKE